MEPDVWFTQLLDALPGDVGPVSEEERVALLDLARVAAHTSDRWTAPISTFLVGLAYVEVAPSERAAAIQELVARLGS
jgi:hypothetical protein